MDPACDELACSQPEGEDSEYGCRAGGVSTQSVPTSRTSAERCGTGCASSDTVRWRTGAGGGAELTRRQHGRPFCASFCSAGRFCGTGGSYARGDHHICSGCSAIFARIDSGCYTECATDCDCDLGTCQPLVSPHIISHHVTSLHTVDVQQAVLNVDGTILLIFYCVQDSKIALIKLIVKATPGNYHSV